MYGLKARIGLIIPSGNVIIEPELNAMKPDGVSVHATRLPFIVGGSIEGLKQMAEGTEEAAKLLASAGVNIIAYGCTTGSLFKGVVWDQELIARIEKATGISATTTATAVIQACRKLGVRRVAVASSYNEGLNRLEKEFLEAHGIRVVNIKGLDIHGEDLSRVSLETTYEVACEVDTPEADAVFISCTGLKSITVIEKLEQELQKYVFSSNTATMWDVMKRVGIGSPIKHYGKLFEY